MSRSAQLPYYTLVLVQEHTTHQRQDRLAESSHDIRLNQPDRERTPGHTKDPCVVLTSLPTQGSQFVADGVIQAGREDDERDVRLRKTLRLLTVPQKGAADQLRYVARL